FRARLGLVVWPSHNRGRRECRVPNAGNAGCPMHPQPRVRFVVGVCTRVFTAEAPETSGIPHAMVLRLIARSPRGPGSFAPVIPEKLASQELDASVGAPGPHAFAVRAPPHRKSHPTVLVPFRRNSNEGGFSVIRLLTPPRPPHPAPTPVTIAKRPSDEAG